MKANEQREALISEIKESQKDDARTIKVSLLEGELQKLRGEIEKGQAQRATLEQQLRSADQQILYISGAIKILEELIAESTETADENTG